VTQSLANSVDSPEWHNVLYEISFLNNDAVGMQKQLASGMGSLGLEDVLLGAEAETAAYFGRLEKGRTFSRQAVTSAERAQQKEAAATYEVNAALVEALFGNHAQALQRAASALHRSNGRDVQYGTALALLLTGEAARAQTLADDLARRFPEDTMVQYDYVPTLRAQIALTGNNARKAIETPQTVASYDLASPSFSSASLALYPAYFRGEAYLFAHQSSDAVAEFHKVLDHRGIVLNEPIGALAHLQLGRAYAMQGDTAKARAAYKDFLTLWKDADTDIPMLKEAKAEYAKLQ
jgi:eukaryotic-like serine/threonine-protein kinase